MSPGMKVLLIDADSKIPNIALMKLSSYYRQSGYDVDLLRLKLSYYPHNKKIHYIQSIIDKYEKVFCSVIFKGNVGCVCGKNIIFGGTGYNLHTALPDNVENLDPDYSIYPENDTSYGFISRGCIRNCGFCVVPKKEGNIRQVSTIDKIVRHKKVKFLDNNFLALPNHIDLMHELIDKNIKHQFNQGLDIRLVGKCESELLSRLNYMGEYIFAFDNHRHKKLIDEKLKLMNWRKGYEFKFFVYTHPNMEINNIVNRIEFLKEKRCLPYIMRDISCFGSEHEKFYTDLASWCNQPGIFKKLDFKTFLEKRHNGKSGNERIEKHIKLYYGWEGK